MPNPFDPVNPVNPARFAGRSMEVQSLSRRLQSTISGSPQHSAIMGERGIGKTSLLRKFQEEARDRRCIVARVDLHHGMHDLESLLIYIHEELRKDAISYYSVLGRAYQATRNFLENYSVSVPVIGGGMEKKGFSPLEVDFRDRLLNIWSKVQGKVPAIVIMIDEAETLAQIEGALEYLRNNFSRLGEERAKYCLVISGKTGLLQSVSELYSPLERFFQPITLAPLTAAEISELLRKAASEASISFETPVEKLIINESEGQPCAVQIFGHCLFEAASDAGTRVVDRKILEKASSTITRMLETILFIRRFREGVGHSKYKLAILKKMADAQQDAYSFTEIARMTKVDKKQGLGVYLTQLVDAACLRKDETTGKYQFFMSLFKKFVRSKEFAIGA